MENLFFFALPLLLTFTGGYLAPVATRCKAETSPRCESRRDIDLY